MQAESGTALPPRRRLVELHEAFEHPLAILDEECRGHDRRRQTARCRRRAGLGSRCGRPTRTSPRSRRGSTGCVRASNDRQQSARSRSVVRRTRRRRRRNASARSAPKQLGNVDGLRVDGYLGMLGRGDEQQLVDQSLQPPALVDRHPEQLCFLLTRHPAVQPVEGVHRSEHDAERCAQLVRHGRDEVALLAIQVDLSREGHRAFVVQQRVRDQQRRLVRERSRASRPGCSAPFAALGGRPRRSRRCPSLACDDSANRAHRVAVEHCDSRVRGGADFLVRRRDRRAQPRPPRFRAPPARSPGRRRGPRARRRRDRWHSRRLPIPVRERAGLGRERGERVLERE